MKKVLGSLAAVAVLSSAVHAVELKNDVDKFSYVVAQNMAESMKRQGIQVNAAVFSASLNSYLAGEKSAMSRQEMDDFMRGFQQKMMAKMKAEQEAAGKVNLEAGKKYLEANKKKGGFTETMSGLQYRVIKKGSGPMPKETDRVEVHYVGTLIDGTEFDSSIKRGQPTVFPVNAVIKGWTEALKMMPVGSKWELVVPSEIAYGASMRGPGGPNSVLKFEVELLSIKEPVAPAAGAKK